PPSWWSTLPSTYSTPSSIRAFAMTDVVRIFRRSSAALFGLGLVVIMAVLAVLAPWLAPRDPDAIDTARRLAPILTAGHPLGTDEFGRDLLSRLLFGARISLVVGLTASGLAAPPRSFR